MSSYALYTLHATRVFLYMESMSNAGKVSSGLAFCARKVIKAPAATAALYDELSITSPRLAE